MGVEIFDMNNLYGRIIDFDYCLEAADVSDYLIEVPDPQKDGDLAAKNGFEFAEYLCQRLGAIEIPVYEHRGLFYSPGKARLRKTTF